MDVLHVLLGSGFLGALGTAVKKHMDTREVKARSDETEKRVALVRAETERMVAEQLGIASGRLAAAADRLDKAEAKYTAAEEKHEDCERRVSQCEEKHDERDRVDAERAVELDAARKLVVKQGADIVDLGAKFKTLSDQVARMTPQPFPAVKPPT